MKKGFTLLELIVVIIILGVLATLGYTQYTNTVEKGRLAEAIARIGYMRKLATEYYYKNGSLDGIQNSDIEAESGCDSTGYYFRQLNASSSTWVNLAACRCTSGGKPPNDSRGYVYYLWYYPGTGQSTWYCYWQDTNTGCFGLSTWP